MQAQKVFLDDTMKRVSVSTDIAAAVKRANLVVEAIVENIDVKRQLFAQIEQHAPAFDRAIRYSDLMM